MAYDLTAPSDPSLSPGEARCPGPSTRDIILAEADGAPETLTAESYQFLGDEPIPFDRYYSKVFFDLEMERLWTRTWQWACREEHIPEPGDYVIYDIGHHSFIVMRSDATTIKAFYNSCPHRGMQFCEPGSHGKAKQFLRCPFHGMSWELDGALREIPCRWDFPHIDDSNFRLPEINVATWGGFVFVNMDPEAVPLEEYLGVLPEHFKNWPLQDRYVSIHVAKTLPANWKMAQEAFLEAFHVLATHPQGLATAGDANAQYDLFGEHVTRFVHTIGYPSPHLKDQPSENELLRNLGGWNLVDPEIGVPDGQTARSIWAENLRTTLGAEFGVDLSGVSNSEMLDSIEYHLFPNMCLFPGISLPMIYRFRPNGSDPDTCIHEILFLTPIEPGAPRPAPAPVYKLGIDDSYTTAPGFSPGLAPVYDQDTGNLRRQRDGAKASGVGAQQLGNYQEVRTRKLHQTVDAYLEKGPLQVPQREPLQ